MCEFQKRRECCTRWVFWIDQNWIKSTILPITSFWGGFKEWKLEEFQRIHWVILSIGSKYSKTWRIVEIEEVSINIIRFYVMAGWWWWLMWSFIISRIFLGGRKGKGWRVQISLDIGGLYLPLEGLSLPLYLEAVATFGSQYFPWTINYWLFLIYCAWCIMVYWCKSYTIFHWSLDIVEWFKYKLKKVLNCTLYWFTPLSISTIILGR